MFHAYASLATAYWGASTFLSQYIALFGGIILFGSSFYYLFSPRIGFLISCIASMLISVLYFHFAFYVFSNYPLKKILDNLHYVIPIIPLFVLLTASILISFLGYTGLGRKKYPKDWIFPPNQPISGGLYVILALFLSVILGTTFIVLNTGKHITKEYTAKVVKWDREEILAFLEEYPGYSVSGSSEDLFSKFEKPEKVQIKVLFIKDFFTIISDQVLSINGINLEGEEHSRFFLFKNCGTEGFIRCEDPASEKRPPD